jgi:hypothetical protein
MRAARADYLFDIYRVILVDLASPAGTSLPESPGVVSRESNGRFLGGNNV